MRDVRSERARLSAGRLCACRWFLVVVNVAQEGGKEVRPPYK